VALLDEDSWLAYCPAVRRASAWDCTKEEAFKNIRKVAQITLESMIDHGERIPEESEEEVKVVSEAKLAVTVRTELITQKYQDL